MPRREGDLRCFCSKTPLLGKFGIDVRGHGYIHVRVYKQGKVFGEIIVTGDGATARIMCRDCLRWFKVTIRQGVKPDFRQEELPESLKNGTSMLA